MLSLLGGFFLVDRCNSAVIFVVRLTSTLAEKTDRTTCEEMGVAGSGGSIAGGGSGKGVRGETGLDEPREENSEEKNPVCADAFEVRNSRRGGGFFSDPPVYTRRRTSAVILRAIIAQSQQSGARKVDKQIGSHMLSSRVSRP